MFVDVVQMMASIYKIFRKDSGTSCLRACT